MNELRQKIEYYIITLSFTLLVLSIQSVCKKTVYPLDNEQTQNLLIYFEYPSWFLFFISGMLGILKLYLLSHKFLEKNKYNIALDSEKSRLIKLINCIKVFQFLFLGCGFIALIMSRSLTLIK